MEYTHLGRTGLSVSRLCLGTMNFGPVIDAAASVAIMDRAIDAGINFFDTADVYGLGDDRGRVEANLGEWFAGGGARRDKVVLATKVYGDMGSWPNDGGLSALHIRRACEASLRRLQTDRIDLYQMHHIDRSTPWEEIWEAMEVLRQQGKILYVGSSNFAGWHLVRAQEAALRRGDLGLASEQSIYSLAERRVELEVLPAARALGIGLLPWSPLHGGVLGGILRKRADGTAYRSTGPFATEDLAKIHDRVVEWERFCDERGRDPGELALAWLLHQDGVTAPVIGPRTVEQLDGALRAMSIRLEDQDLSELDRIFPGPGGPAPEAYYG